MVFQLIKLNIDVSDESFNEIYPESIRKFSGRHWTPVAVAKMAAAYLADQPGARVLDIGSGAGKFCMIGAASTQGYFSGVEQRSELVKFCEKAARIHHLKNVSYINANITSVDFNGYDAFYLFNPFRENIDKSALIDESVVTGPHLFDFYGKYVYENLSKCRIGTRVATYWNSVTDVPSEYTVVGTGFEGRLNLFEKIR